MPLKFFIASFPAVLAVMSLLAFPTDTWAEQEADKQKQASAPVKANQHAVLRAKLRQAEPSLRILGIGDSPVRGLSTVRIRGDQPLYISDDGSYLMVGTLFEINAQKGLINRFVVDALRKEHGESAIVFAPRDKKRVRATLTVFTDIDCGYCRKLHNQIDDMNRLGIAVRYLAFPRAGLDSETRLMMSSAWCAGNQQAALTALKRGQPIDRRRCSSDPVPRQYELGRLIGVRGTPAIYTETGRQIGGYLAVSELLNALGLH